MSFKTYLIARIKNGPLTDMYINEQLEAFINKAQPIIDDNPLGEAIIQMINDHPTDSFYGDIEEEVKEVTFLLDQGGHDDGAFDEGIITNLKPLKSSQPNLLLTYLQEIYTSYCISEDLPAVSAEEHGAVKPNQREWLDAFIVLWEAAQ